MNGLSEPCMPNRRLQNINSATVAYRRCPFVLKVVLLLSLISRTVSLTTLWSDNECESRLLDYNIVRQVSQLVPDKATNLRFRRVVFLQHLHNIRIILEQHNTLGMLGGPIMYLILFDIT